MKNLNNYITENKTDDAIKKAFASMTLSEDINGLGEEFARKYEDSLLDSLVNFIDGVENGIHYTTKDEYAIHTIQDVRTLLLNKIKSSKK